VKTGGTAIREGNNVPEKDGSCRMERKKKQTKKNGPSNTKKKTPQSEKKRKEKKNPPDAKRNFSLVSKKKIYLEKEKGFLEKETGRKRNGTHISFQPNSRVFFPEGKKGECKNHSVVLGEKSRRFPQEKKGRDVLVGKEKRKGLWSRVVRKRGVP